jgi:DNA replication protein DnaC
MKFGLCKLTAIEELSHCCLPRCVLSSTEAIVNLLMLSPGDNEFCLDQLAFETLVAKSTLHRYVSLLYDHRKLVFHGSSGTGKSHMAMKLAQCIVRRYGILS